MPSLAAEGYLLFILSAVGRTGINPVPTADVCNALVINGLSKRLQHTSNVGVGFIEAAEKVRQLSQFVCSMLYLCNYGLKIIPEKFGYVTEN